MAAEEGGTVPADRVLGTFKFPRFGYLLEMKSKVSEIIVPADVPFIITSNYILLPSVENILWVGEDTLYVKGHNFGVSDGVSSAE